MIGEKIDDFVETLSKHAEKMTDDKEIEHAGRLVRLLIGNRDISKKEVMFNFLLSMRNLQSRSLKVVFICILEPINRPLK